MKILIKTLCVTLVFAVSCKPKLQTESQIQKATHTDPTKEIAVGNTISLLIKKRITCPDIIQDAGTCYSNYVGDITRPYCRVEGDPILEDETIRFKIVKHGPPTPNGIQLVATTQNYRLGCFHIKTVGELEGSLGLIYIRVTDLQ